MSCAALRQIVRFLFKKTVSRASPSRRPLLFPRLLFSLLACPPSKAAGAQPGASPAGGRTSAAASKRPLPAGRGADWAMAVCKLSFSLKIFSPKEMQKVFSPLLPAVAKKGRLPYNDFHNHILEYQSFALGGNHHDKTLSENRKVRRRMDL